MFNSTRPLFHPPPPFFSSISQTSFFPLFIFLLPSFFHLHLLFAHFLLSPLHFPMSMSVSPPVVHPTAPPPPSPSSILAPPERAAKEPEGAQNVARPAGERCYTGPRDWRQSHSTVPGLYVCVSGYVCTLDWPLCAQTVLLSAKSVALHCGDQTAAVHIFSQSGLFHQAFGIFSIFKSMWDIPSYLLLRKIGECPARERESMISN